MMFGSREVFRYFQCTACGCLQADEITADFGRFYPSDYYSFNLTPPPPKHGALHRWLQKQRCRTALFEKGYKLNTLLKPYVELPTALFEKSGGIPPGEILRKCSLKDFSARFLDVGCGAHSKWLAALAGLGFYNLVGVDPFIPADQQHGNIRIFKRELEGIEGTFDLITLHHSLEHISDQLSLLKAVRARLGKGGTCLVRIPIVPSHAWEKYGTNWVELDAPRHLFLHSVGSITDLGRQAGLELYDVVYDSLSFEFYGSEQYARDIPLNDPRSLWINPDSDLFTPEEKENFEAMAVKVNAERRGGRAGFYLRAIS
jgi:SAM-dependent methyltransferase